jgi:hypothetical protein
MADSLSKLSKEFREALLRRNLSIGDLKLPETTLNTEIRGYEPPSDNPDSSLSISNLNGVTSNLAYNRYSFGDEIAQHQPQETIVRYNGSETYLDKYNLGSEETGKIKTFNAIGSILNGTGLGYDGSGFEDTFDVRSSLMGRVLSATGVINDTPLGMIANKELMNAMINRVMFNTQRETLGRINIDPINAIKGGDIIRPDYSITIGHNFGTKALETLEDLTGINLPFSQLSPDASISKKGYSQALIKNTGKGQVNELFFNLNQNKFGPDYKDERIKKISLEDKKDYKEISDNFTGLVDSDSEYDNISPKLDSLLSKTQFLFFKDRNFAPLNKAKGMEVPKSEISNTTALGGTHYMSKGSGVLNESALRGVPDENGNIFGRVFTKDNQYSHVKNLQKNSGLLYKDSADDSVLDSNGFIKVAPDKNDFLEGKEGSVKNFMFSIENLAWHGSDAYGDLSESEKGVGDLINGTKGRVMWFPPYDLSFAEVTSVNWESTQFIGRGEPIYTYNNTERVGSLDFKVIMDYPSYMEDLKGLASDDLFKAIAAGVSDVDYDDFKNLALNEKRDIEVKTVVKPQTIMDSGQTEPLEFELYYDFENDDAYQAYGPNDYTTQVENSFFTDLADKLIKECPACTITIKGFSDHDEVPYRAFQRAATFKYALKTSGGGLLENKIKTYPDMDGENITGCLGNEFPSDSDCKRKARKVHVSFEYDPTQNEVNDKNVVPQVQNPERDLNNSLKKKFINEALYFEKLSKENPLVYESISESIKHFHPAFHSVTPEGFNSRLNFLHQCTRQGPTKSDTKASNLAFGRPPVCILRLGDFYHTKIVIDSVNLTFEDHQWDLNPEGAGVQPMIAKVSLSFKFIGGSSLKGPINKLQNAISNNFFANNEVFNDKADRIIKRNGEWQYASDLSKVESVNALEPNKPFGGEEVLVTSPEIDEEARAEGDNQVEGENLPEKFINNLSFGSTTTDNEFTYVSLTFSKIDNTLVYDPPLKLKVTIEDHVQDKKYNTDSITIDEDIFNNLGVFNLQDFVEPEEWDWDKEIPYLTITFTYENYKRSTYYPDAYNINL